MKNKEELQKLGAEIAKLNKVDALTATSDGQFFLPGKENLASLHARANKLQVFALDYSNKEATQAEAPKKESTKKPKAEDQIAAIEKAETVSEVTEILGKDTRVTVKDAAKAKIEALQSKRED